MPGGTNCDPRKKLKAAATAWARGGRGGSQVDPDDPNADALAKHLASRKPVTSATIEICAEDQEAFALFVALDTQWRWHPMIGLRTGIAYEAVPATAAMCGFEMTPGLLADIRLMETAALNVWSKR